MTDKPYPNEALTDICKQLLDDWDLTPEQIDSLAQDIVRECNSIAENRSEAIWEWWNSREPDDSAYRTDMINAGRGQLLR